jgi:hypothetical protein
MHGAAGHIQAMITNLKNNKSILKKRKSFKEIREEFRYINRKNLPQENYDKEILELRERLRKEIIKENKKNLFSLIITTIVFASICYLIVVYFIN